MTGIVYFLYADSFCGNPCKPIVKIGWTTNTERGCPTARYRLEEIQTGYPGELKIIGCVVGEKGLEGDVKRRFANLRVHGKWFWYTEEIYQYLKDNGGAQ